MSARPPSVGGWEEHRERANPDPHHTDNPAVHRAGATDGARARLPRAASAHRREGATPSAMIEEYAARVEEGVTLSAYTVEVTAWLQHCYDLLEAGAEVRILA